MIISASRRTDIPSYFSAWFFNRIKEQTVLIRNPMNLHQISRVSLSPQVVDCIVFWTKNPEPMLENLDRLKDYSYYFQFTLNSYGKDIEENLPSKSEHIIDAFKRLSDKIGRNRVIWRYDPIFLNEKYPLNYHIRYFEKLALTLKDYTEKCTISFLDYYPKIRSNLAALNLQELDIGTKRKLAEQLSQIAFACGLRMDTCAEDIELSDLGISHAKCVDGKLIETIIGCPIRAEKDPNQRPACGCAASIDIGAYQTCPTGCKYCYANHSSSSGKNNFPGYDAASPLLCGTLGSNDKISERAVQSLKDPQLDLFV